MALSKQVPVSLPNLIRENIKTLPICIILPIIHYRTRLQSYNNLLVLPELIQRRTKIQMPTLGKGISLFMELVIFPESKQLDFYLLFCSISFISHILPVNSTDLCAAHNIKQVTKTPFSPSTLKIRV